MILSQWHAQWLERCALVNERQIFFVVGCQKSGTTWIERLLNCHPEVICRGEGHLIDTLLPLMKQAVSTYSSQQLAKKRAHAEIVLQDDDLRSGFKALCDAILARYVATASDPARIRAVGDKTPEHANAIPLLADLYPQAKFIHIIRDGRDGAVSGWAHLQRKGGAEKFVGFAAYAEYFARGHWKPYILNAREAGAVLPGRYHEVRYEALHTAPHDETRTLLSFLGVTHDDEAVERSVAGASFESLTGGRSRGEADASSHFRKGVVGDWRESFDDDATQAFERQAGELLRALGYAKTNAAVA